MDGYDWSGQLEFEIPLPFFLLSKETKDFKS
jgi:hypothetical protein